jgi:Asp-tRNA(Asn)/Glu-tRNA(Gln) amidotransferase A subunit family amidase
MADVAFGTDTCGSVRVPAACCGIVGLKTTFGLVPVDGIYPIAPNQLDTVGPMGKDVAHVVQGMDLLKAGFAAQYRRAVSNHNSARRIRVGRLYLAGTDPKIDLAVDGALETTHFELVRLDADFTKKWIQAQKDAEIIAAVSAWIYDEKFRYEFGVTLRTKAVVAFGGIEYRTSYRDALRRQAAWKIAMRQVFKKVDFIALPTMQTLPPAVPLFGGTVAFEKRVLGLQNTGAVNLAGVPAVAIPVPSQDRSVPVTSLQLVGPGQSEAALLSAARMVELATPLRPENGDGSRSEDLKRQSRN